MSKHYKQPDPHERALTWITHHSPLLVVAVIVLYLFGGLIDSWAYSVVVVVLFVGSSLAYGAHIARKDGCDLCTVTDASPSADEAEWREDLLRWQHKVNGQPLLYGVPIVGVVAGAFLGLLSPTFGLVVHLAAAAGLIGLYVADWLHTRLRPVCPWCHDPHAKGWPHVDRDQQTA